MSVGRTVMLVLVAAVGLVRAAPADTVRFKSGVEVQGRVKWVRGMVRIENADGTFTVAASRVEGVVPEVSFQAEPRQDMLAGGDETSVRTYARPEVSLLSSGVEFDVRPIVSADRRYVFLGLHLLRRHGWIGGTYSFQSGGTRTRR